MKYTKDYNKDKGNILPNVIDGDHKLEILLFGKIMGKLYILGAFDIFKFSSWNKSIKEHLEKFIILNSEQKNEVLEKESIKYKDIQISELNKDNDVPSLLKILFKEYASIKDIKDGVIHINTKFSSSRNEEINNLDNNNNIIKIDVNYYSYFERASLKDCYP